MSSYPGSNASDGPYTRSGGTRVPPGKRLSLSGFVSSKKQSGGSSKPPLTFDPTRSYVPPGLEEMIDEQASKYDKSIRDSAKAALEVSSLVEYVRAADEGPSNWDEERETRELIGTAIRDADKRAKSAASQYAAERKAASDKKPWPAFEQVQSLFRVIGMDPKKAAKVSEHSKIPESRW